MRKVEYFLEMEAINLFGSNLFAKTKIKITDKNETISTMQLFKKLNPFPTICKVMALYIKPLVT